MDRIRNVFIIIFGSVFFVGIAFFMLLLWQDMRRLKAESAEINALATTVSEQHATLTTVARITPPPTATAPPDRYATMRAEVVATTEARPIALEQAKQWAILVQDRFDNNDNQWDTEAGDPELSLDKRRIADGVYSWEINAFDGFSWVENLPDYVLPKRFYLSLEIDQANRLQNDQGIVFHYQDPDNYYLFSLCTEAGTVGTFRKVDDVWYTMQSCRQQAAIYKDQANTLAVIGDDNHYLFFINDQFIADLWDDHFLQGEVGVYIEMNPDEQNSFYFDNLEVRSAELGR